MFLSKFLKKQPKLLKQMANDLKQPFGSGGPYNPYRYKDYLMPSQLPKDEEVIEYVRSIHSIPPSPVRNVRHINPVRQSGPLPSYDGVYNMEDIRKVMWNTSVGNDFCYCAADVDEIMRRVPGITRKEADHITKLGLTPDEQIDFAYIAFNIGLDVFYLTNQMFTARQVVTNSKGDKVEVLWNAQAYEDLSLLNVGFSPNVEFIDYHWEIFLWADPPIHPLPDMDLCVHNTWFEYELEHWGEMTLLEDQMTLPEDQRQFPSPRNPHARKELWRNQENLQEEINMQEESWYPENTKYNIYRQSDYKKPKNDDVNI